MKGGRARTISEVILIVSLFLATHAQAQSDAAPKTSTGLDVFATLLDERVPRYLEEFGVPGAAVAVIRNGEVAFGRGYGFADAARREPVTIRTGFNVASIAKPVTAWGVMRLVEQGRLELDAPVEQYLTRWHLPPSEFDASGVTVRRLLSHTAGLSVEGYPGWGPGQELPTLEETLAGASGTGVQLIMEPGTDWRYSGGGYTLVQLLVEEVTGRRFADYMRDEVLHPLGMYRSGFVLTPDVIAGSSTPFDQFGEPTPPVRLTAEAAGGLHTTAEDLSAFAAAAGGTVPGRGVVTPESVTLMTTPAPASDGRYGFGYIIEPFRDGMETVGHDGSHRGWQSIFKIVPETGDGLVVLTNGTNGFSAYQQVICDWMEWQTGSRPPCLKSVASTLAGTLRDKGLDAAIERYAVLKNAHRDEYRFREQELNRLGYALLQSGRVEDAVAIFELNVAEYPEAANPYDSLGEAYMESGDVEMAIRNYRKSLELNPANTNAVEMLERLEGK